jgi:hypothetical protein
MNCNDFTSSNGNRNGQRNQGTANCGARAEQHHNTSIDFLERPVPDVAKHGRANAEAFTHSCQFFADSRQTVATEPLWEPAVVLAQRLSFSPSKTEIASAT